MSVAQAFRVAAAMIVGLSVAACGRSGHVPDNEPPFGAVDMPAAGAVLRPGPTLVGGWAVDDSSVREIRVYFDGHLEATTVIAVRRPDVAKAMPRYARVGALHGWNVLVDFGMAPGAHVIRVQAVDDQGATRNIGVIPVTVPD